MLETYKRVDIDSSELRWDLSPFLYLIIPMELILTELFCKANVYRSDSVDWLLTEFGRS